ncbi:MAG: EamA family transporter [Acidimicrobiales bacterium]
MAALLALFSAATYGVGDFCGGLAARRIPSSTVVLWSHLVGLALLVLSTVVVSGALVPGDLVIGAVGGLCGAAGVGLLYQGLSVNRMSVIAPVTALLSAAVPLLAGYLGGERPGGPAALGMALALVAIVLVSAEGDGHLRSADRRGVTFAIGAGLGFGLFFVALSHTGADAGLWPLVSARTASVTVLGLAAALGLVSRRAPAAGSRRLTIAAGALDAQANVLYLLAVRQGLVSVVSVLAALYPVSTVVLARVVLRERFARVQLAGMLLAVPATVLMAL